jgi:hypothetical protein
MDIVEFLILLTYREADGSYCGAFAHCRYFGHLPYTYTRLARSCPLAFALPKMLRSYVSRCRVPKSLATLPQIGVRTSRLSPIRHFKASTPKHLGPTPKLQEVKYVRFGDSNSSGGNNRWHPFRDGKWDTPSKLLAAAVGAGGLYYVMQ